MWDSRERSKLKVNAGNPQTSQGILKLESLPDFSQALAEML